MSLSRARGVDGEILVAWGVEWSFVCCHCCCLGAIQNNFQQYDGDGVRKIVRTIVGMENCFYALTIVTQLAANRTRTLWGRAGKERLKVQHWYRLRNFKLKKQLSQTNFLGNRSSERGFRIAIMFVVSIPNHKLDMVKAPEQLASIRPPSIRRTETGELVARARFDIPRSAKISKTIVARFYHPFTAWLLVRRKLV